MKRRALLTVAAAVVTAGCPAIPTERDESVRLGTLHLENRLEREAEVAVEITSNGDETDETTVTLAAADPPTAATKLLEPNWPAEAQSYTLRFDAEVGAEPLEVNLDEPSVAGCESFIVTLRPGSIDACRSTSGECYDER